MSAGVLLVVILVGLLATIGLVGLANAGTSHAFDAAGRTLERRRQRTVSLLTRLSAKEISQAALTACRQVDGQALIQDLDDGLLISRGDAKITLAISQSGEQSCIALSAGGSGRSTDFLPRYQGTLLAVLRQNDPGAKQARK